MGDDGEGMPLFIHWPVAIIASVIGICFSILMGASTVAQISTENWENTTGIVEEYEMICIEYEDNGYDGLLCSAWEEDIVYSYNVGTEYTESYKLYTNTEISLSWRTPDYGFSQRCENYWEFWGSCARIQIGDEIDVFFNPENPSDSVLLSGWDGIDFGDFIILGISTIMPLCLLITARRKGTISEALDQFKGLAQTAKDIQSEKNGFKPNNLQYRPTRNVGGTSRERSYNSVINRLNLHSLQKDEQAIKERMIHKFSFTPTQAQSFIQSEHVRLTLQLDAPPMPPIPPLSEGTMQSPLLNEEKENNDQLDMMAVFASAMEENLGVDSPDSFEPKPLSSGMSYCEHPGCNVTVSNTDFRCFKCRRTFCYDHKGTSVVCPEGS